MTKMYAKVKLASHVAPSVVMAKQGDVVHVYKEDGEISLCLNAVGVRFAVRSEKLSADPVAAAPEETPIIQPKRRRR